MAVRSKRLFGPVEVGTTGTVVYTCPSGETALLKCFTAAVGTIVNATVRLHINGSATANLLLVEPVLNGEGLVLTDLFVVLHPGDTLRASTSSGTFTVTGHGAELEGVAD